MTIGGDSGSAILAGGFLVGIASQSAAQGGAIFIPTGCFFDQFVSADQERPFQDVGLPRFPSQQMIPSASKSLQQRNPTFRNTSVAHFPMYVDSVSAGVA